MNITKEQWQTDVQNTKKELEAYQKIANGFEILENLPENIESGKCYEYRTQVFLYESLAARCEEFLEKLLSFDVID